MGRTPIVALEGPSAVGKTTLAEALAREHGAAVVPEVSAVPPPPPGEAAEWWIARHAERWARAVDLARDAPFVVLDGDPLKSLWYGWIYADEAWADVDVVVPLLRARIDRGELSLPDLTVALTADEARLRARRDGDATRTRRRFEKHLRMVAPLRRYFAALAEAAPGRVLLLDTEDRAALAGRVAAAVAALPANEPESLAALDGIAAWLRRQGPVPTGEGGGG